MGYCISLVQEVVNFDVGRKGHMGTILLVYSGGELGWVPVLSMVWEYGASGYGQVSGGALGCEWLIGVER